MLQLRAVFAGQLRREAGEFVLSDEDGIQCGLRGIGFATVGIAAHLIARMLHVAAEFVDPVEHGQVIALEHLFFDAIDTVGGALRAAAKACPIKLAGLGGLIDFAEDVFVLRDRLQLLVDHGQILRDHQLLAGERQIVIDIVQQVIDLAGAILTVIPVVGHAGNAQVFDQRHGVGNGAELFAAINDRRQSAPAGGGNQQRHDQHQAKAETEFAIDADIAQRGGQPMVHGDAPYLIDSHRCAPSMATEYAFEEPAYRPQRAGLEGFYTNCISNTRRR